MKRRRGFTLVELLAVIAILAILVIIALPNVMGMFNDAKKSSFTTECKRIFKIAEQTYMNDSLYNQDEKEYAKCDTCTQKKLDLSGRDNIDYYIKFNKGGKVVKFYVSDGDYQYEYDDNNPLNIEDITKVDSIADLDNKDVLIITNDGADYNRNIKTYYTAATVTFRIGDDITNYNSSIINKICDHLPDSTQLDYITFSNRYLLKFVIKEFYIVYVKNGVEYIIRGADSGTSYELNKVQLNNLFGSTNCSESVVSGSAVFRCIKNNFSASIKPDGFCSFEYKYNYCSISNNGSSTCYYSDVPASHL